MGKASTEQDFWRQVDVQGPSDCWLWTGAMKDGRYGTFKHQRRGDRSHRWAWFFRFGPIPDGMHVLHSCDVTRCCNPSHLRLGTHAENMADRERRGRNKPRTRASGSHKLTVAQADDIRARWTGGRSTGQLAAEFGVSTVTIWKIGTGRIH